MSRSNVLSVAAAMAVLLAAGFAAPAAAAAESRQGSPVQLSQADVQRLEEAVFDAEREVGRLRERNRAKADTLQARLNDLRDEVIYLKVKMRKEGASRADYGSLRDQIDDIRIEARQAPAAAGAAVPDEPVRQGSSARPNEIPAGTEIDVRLDAPLSSGTAKVEDRFTAATIEDLYNGDQLLIPADSVVRGVVTEVDRAGRLDRSGRLGLAVDQVTVNGQAYPIRATLTQALESGGYRKDARKIGTGAGVGAIIGGILGGLKGALTGILIGGGGVVAATEGQDVNLPAGTVLRIKLDAPLTVKPPAGPLLR
ncbi:MAG TPA: hypothetical protein PLE61_08985 [Vicinamibacterales bacterium]|nr:hypothetical protein [Vicinamibacterales bacterium]HPW20937.1 hypothetical protein [Vicinamibacterales bacterium]